jgi:hypothetical protein
MHKKKDDTFGASREMQTLDRFGLQQLLFEKRCKEQPAKTVSSVLQHLSA